MADELRLAVTGSGTAIGRRVAAADSVVLDGSRREDAARALDGVDAVCLLASGAGAGEPGTRLAELREVLAAAGAAGVRRLVLLSSAVVYGASPDNPVPLPEEAPVRPDPNVGWAVELAEAERLCAEWAQEHPDATVAVLRPALTVAPEEQGFLVRAFGGLDGLRPAGETRPVQFVHVDDVAAAVRLAVERGLDGTFNVAPDGWVDDSEAASLAGTVLPRPGLPARLVQPARRLRWRLGVGATPPAAAAYAEHPWVVAADRLRAEGWQPGYSNAEAIVATTRASALAELSPRRRQELLLAVVAALLVAVGAGAVLAVRRAVRARR